MCPGGLTAPYKDFQPIFSPRTHLKPSQCQGPPRASTFLGLLERMSGLHGGLLCRLLLFSLLFLLILLSNYSFPKFVGIYYLLMSSLPVSFVLVDLCLFKKSNPLLAFL